jgi:DNA polymerase III subunit epsilon
MSRNFAVIDCETTGFGKSDRMLEVAVVVLEGRTLETVDEFDTLLNPMRDVGRSDIHGIKPSMLAAAPAFEEVVAGLARRIDGTVLVGHNLRFDAGFLAQECERAGTAFDAGEGICTYQATGAKLAAAAGHFGIPLEGHHRALVDARATAELFRRVLENVESAPAHMPAPSRTQTVRTLRREAVGAPSTTPLARLLSRACYPSSLDACVEYFDMLDFVLADGVVSPDERLALDRQIAALGLSRAQVDAMHEAYYQSILRAVERDQHVSEDEHAMLVSVARALSVPNAVIPSVTQLARPRSPGALAPGLRVCFTGAATDADGNPIERSDLERLAAASGLQPVSSVTKKSCDLLVAADPESASGKAQKARQYGVPVMSIEAFLEAVEA